ncbi:hypothetical protein M9H77_23426 [Catharanthus roseus]|uniref:Uncharacterized protein n=1 Tax=Catharanthus roseus TaxID=4058 RepID=A0ACC0AXE5_CATRO|nr:hypothetical protein M9H77_23426 [Catharanthus roseus]
MEKELGSILEDLPIIGGFLEFNYASFDVLHAKSKEKCILIIITLSKIKDFKYKFNGNKLEAPIIINDERSNEGRIKPSIEPTVLGRPRVKLWVVDVKEDQVLFKAKS